MTWDFGDSFDPYSSVDDLFYGYWDTFSSKNYSFPAGRFSGSRAISFFVCNITKISNVNDKVHHFVCSFQQGNAPGGTSPVTFFELLDGTTAQCSVVFRSDGTILLTSGGPQGTVIDSWNASILINVWYAFEFEVVIGAGSTGSWAIRKNGNNLNDHAASGLTTQLSANAYANKLTFGGVSGGYPQSIDDLYWRSSSVAGDFLGDIRCVARVPTTDISTQWSRSSYINQPRGASFSPPITAGHDFYGSFYSTADGVISSGVMPLAAGYTGNLKIALYSDGSNAPAAVLGTANVINNPVTGNNTFTFGTPVAISRNTLYWFGFCGDTSAGNYYNNNVADGWNGSTPYASFPIANPATGRSNSPIFSVSITAGNNNSLVAEAQEDRFTTYVWDNIAGDADFYGISPITVVPAATFATTLRAFATKSDAGTRTLVAQMKSGSTTVATPIVVLTTSSFWWAWRTDVTDPDTGLPWTAGAVNSVQIGPKVIA